MRAIAEATTAERAAPKASEFTLTLMNVAVGTPTCITCHRLITRPDRITLVRYLEKSGKDEIEGCV